MKVLFKRLVNSFDTKNAGFSGRKLTAFTLIVMAGFIHYKAELDIYYLIADLVGAFLCLGIITAQHVLNALNSKSDESK